VRRKLHAAEIFVRAEARFEFRVAEHRRAVPRLDALDEILIADHALEFHLVRRRKRHEGFPGTADGFAAVGRVVCHRRLDEALRRHPDLHEPSVDGGAEVALGRRGNGARADHVPRVAAAHDPDLPQLARQRLEAAAKRRILELLAPAIVAHRGRGEVDRHGHGRHREARPGRVRVVRLAEDVVEPAA
jgi:hypothetical protein